VLLLFEKLLAFLRRDLLIASRYRGAFVIWPLAMVIELAGAYYLARAIGAGFRPDGFEYFPFLLVGTAITQLIVTSMHAFVESVRDAQLSGTLEMMMATATPPLTVMLMSAATLLISRVIDSVVYLAVALVLFRAPIHTPHLAPLAVVLLVLSVMTLGLGLFAASLQLYFQRGAAAIWLFGTVLWLLSGSVFPVSALPAALRTVSRMLPITYLVNVTREVLLVQATLSSLVRPLLILAVVAGLFLVVSLGVFSAVLRNARLRGTLSMY
jgi:ABC-2 type transport system permease protein